MPAALQALAGAGGGGRGGGPGAGAAGGGRGGGAAAPAAPVGATLDAVQTSLVAGLDTAVADQLRAVVAARSAVPAESLVSPRNAAALTQKVEALAQAELTLATARADYYARIQRSVARLSARSVAALAAQEAAAVPPAAGGPGGGGGGGGRGGGGVDNATRARTAVLNSPRIDENYGVFVQQAERLAGDVSMTSDGVLLNLASRRIGADAPRQAAARSLDQGWNDPRRKVQIIRAAVAVRDTSRALQIADAVNDADLAVAQTARNAVQTLAINAEALRGSACASSACRRTRSSTVTTTKGTVVRGQQLVSSWAAPHATRVNQRVRRRAVPRRRRRR